MSKVIINTTNAPAPIGPYNQAVFVESTQTLYVSGQIAIDPSSGELIMGDIRRETGQVMKNLKAILNEANMDFQNIVKCSIFISNMDNFGAINEVYGEYFQNDPPARETVEVSCLPKKVNVEISCIAVKF
ncbi:Rid family detoxifying hydrolase [Fulvivirgaceae bacterium BMA10]|uniref:Rid family detoxifying hydrolase n=1 Tax=Splendidivirga corallicola TaxID=3051826 RepID=A0ABT8KT80_9BACT|nr:Rid family detoxifying hydrolase [Fulvivirgaceae bacterium BMA10]